VNHVVVLEKPSESSVSSDLRFDSQGFDPSLVQAARTIYETFATVHPEVTDRPLGVAINRYTYRGKLIFVRYPALLPQECFIPFEVMERA
jgi:hypothetical protein